MSVLQKRITLKCAPLVAFEVFTYDMAKWWPMATHSVSAGSGTLPANLIVERQEGGRIVEIDGDGNTHLWGHFQVYQAPFRVLIAWHVDETPDHSTYIEIVFGMETNGTTSAVLTHGGWELYGIEEEKKRSDYDTGWDHVFGECFKDACDLAAKEPPPMFEPNKAMPKMRRKAGTPWKGSLSDAVHLVH